MWNCFCCGRILPDRAIEHGAKTEEGEPVKVGSDCIKKIRAADVSGHYSEHSDATLFTYAAYEQYAEEA